MELRTPAYELPPIENAKRQYVELYGSALVLNTYLKVALLAVCAVALGLLLLDFLTVKKYETLKPLVIRIDDVGRAQAVQYDALTYNPQGPAPELKYFLTQFVVKHFGRMRATVKTWYAESLYFLDSALVNATINQTRRAQNIEQVLSGSADEIEVHVKNVTLDELKTAPFKAQVDFEQISYTPGSGDEKKRETFVAQISFVIRDQIPNAMILVNPLGLTITYFRIDQAFR